MKWVQGSLQSSMYLKINLIEDRKLAPCHVMMIF